MLLAVTCKTMSATNNAVPELELAILTDRRLRVAIRVGFRDRGGGVSEAGGGCGVDLEGVMGKMKTDVRKLGTTEWGVVWWKFDLTLVIRHRSERGGGRENRNH